MTLYNPITVFFLSHILYGLPISTPTFYFLNRYKKWL